MPRVAFDIETVSPMIPNDERPEFGNPDHFEIASAGIAVEEDGEVVDRRHLTRDGWGPERELALIDDIAHHLETLGPETTYTYNGTDFDFFLLEQRAAIQGQEVGESVTYDRVRALEGEIGHVDLKEPAWERWGNYTRLEEALVNAGVFESEDELEASQTLLTDYEHGVDYSTWPWKGPGEHVVESTDVAVLGEHYLDGVEEGRDDEEFQELERLLDHYVRNDVEHLFPLADALQ